MVDEKANFSNLDFQKIAKKALTYDTGFTQDITEQLVKKSTPEQIVLAIALIMRAYPGAALQVIDLLVKSGMDAKLADTLTIKTKEAVDLLMNSKEGKYVVSSTKHKNETFIGLIIFVCGVTFTIIMFPREHNFLYGIGIAAAFAGLFMFVLGLVQWIKDKKTK